jgi:GDP-L-fucose synthase
MIDTSAVKAFMAAHRPHQVFVTGGKTAGLAGNQKYPADLMVDNVAVALNLIRAAHEHQPCKVLYLASSCSYPRDCPQPMQVESLLTGPLERTNEAYAMAKLTGIQLCQAYRRQYGDPFIAGIPANSFGIEDDFNPEDSHVVGALLHRMHGAKMRGDPAVTIWGTGKARREFMFADDIAGACITVMARYSSEIPINISGGQEVSIAELAAMIKDVVGYQGALQYDTCKPDGMPLKALDGSMLASLGWKSETTLYEGLVRTYTAYRTRSSWSAQAAENQENRGTAHA